MSEREKRLLILLLGALFIVLNLGVYAKVYVPKLEQAKATLDSANARVEQAQINLESRSVYEEDMAWLAKNEPKPTTAQRVQTQLQQVVANYARSSGLTIPDGGQRLQETVGDPALSYHRARIRVLLQGTEQQLYTSLVRLHSPREFRAVTFLRVNPQKSEPTKIDAEVMVEQWFVPTDNPEGT